MIRAAQVGLGWWGKTLVESVQGTNIVRKELGLPEATSLGADPKFSLLRTT